MILQWSQKLPPFRLQWTGPGLITTEVIASLVEAEKILAVISGPRGEKGDNGDVAGNPDVAFSWSPPSAQQIWVIPHNLGKFPSVTVLDSENRVVTAAVTYLNINSVEVAFAFATTGTAYLN